MDSIDVSKGRWVILQDPIVLETLAPELLEVIRSGSSSKFLDAIAVAALEPKLTTRFFVRFENVFADTCARWMQMQEQPENQSDTRIFEAFARVLPFAPHLSVYLENKFPSNREVSSPRVDLIGNNLQGRVGHEFGYSDLQIERELLAFYRIINFDKPTFEQKLSTIAIQGWLKHENVSVRYLAIRVFCQILSASDCKLEEMLAKYIPHQQPLMGDFDGQLIDYAFLSLYERKRLEDVLTLRQDFLNSNFKTAAFHPERFCDFVVPYGNVLLPRPDGPPTSGSNLVTTRTTSENVQNFSKALLQSSPILLHGLSGSGKTSLVNDFARELKKDSKMVTLHLNEQTDAKMLIGMYSTEGKPGSFTWRPGVLTTAVREGRWVFIEDLDRAPNEVISIILPLIERGDLVIPSHGETIRAGRGFRLIASIRTSLNMNGNEIPPPMHMLGARLWNRVPVKIPSRDEFGEIISNSYPILQKFLPGIIQVFDRLYMLFQNPTFAARSRTSLSRPISPRDLLKWCRRLHARLIAAGSRSGEEPITEGTKDEMFMEAADCFAGSLQTEDSRTAVISCIAEEMHISPQRLEHYLKAHVPVYEDGGAEIQIGRVRLSKRITSSHVTKAKKARPFANTVQTKRLMEQVGAALDLAEPVLLVGETGIGKTAVVQQLADSLGYKLTAVNLSQQSEVSDLLGGFKPVNVKSLAIPLKEEFDELFAATGISATRNQKYLDQLGKCLAKSQWTRVSKLWREAPRMFTNILSDARKLSNGTTEDRKNTQNPAKRRKTESKLDSLLELEPRWQRFSESLDQFDIQLSGGSRGFAFSFIEGNIVRAARNGDWVLLDEVNLASPDTLESIADLIQSGSGISRSIMLSETGRIERVQAHPDFRIFAAMNPATDVGKKDLPAGLRSRFTEIYVESPDRSLEDLLVIVKAYLKRSSTNDERAANDVARLYLNTKRLADEKHLVDGANQVPHFSLRTLTRVLSYVTEIAPSYGLRRSLYEGFAMGFLTLLDSQSERMLMPLINHHLLESHGNPQALLAQIPRHPEDGREYVQFINKRRDRQYWMLRGRETPQEQPHYIITPFVERNLLNLVRATSTRRFPVLVQGPTSSGKTSMIEYLAKFSGNKFVRINNHEHTDLQEYIGTYVSGSDGHLRFQEGLLIQALREGHWIVLDELNLAPSDVLEALNRLLDDNRELLIPETQEVVRPHENFMLFATQNPPGLYGGRKTLSRAFRNRFLELHFDDIPENELEYILEHRSQKTAPSDCKRIVNVYKELSRLRQSNRLFEQKDSFATLRDLFRWALRDADNREQLAANGYMLLGERVRKPEERAAVKEIIERVMKVKIDPNVLYDAAFSSEIKLYNQTTNIQGVVWTRAMRRLFILVCQALKCNEPVLLVGETGCGKTTICQMIAEAYGNELHIVNAHQNTETGDLIGAQRPVRNRATISKQLEADLRDVMIRLNLEGSGVTKNLETMLTAFNGLDLASSSVSIPIELSQRIAAAQVKAKALFEWCDGSLVQAMKEGQFFLLDEISLADDSVLERLNSVLESHRTLLLAEKGAEDSFVQASDGFQFFATMNPGGDYGKRELSPALRNRFTEIWVPPLSELDDVLQIVAAKLKEKVKQFAEAIVAFAEWFGQTYRSTSSQSISVRDILAWITFINGFESSDPYFNVVHGAAMVYIDTLGANPAALLAINPENILEERQKCLQKLGSFLKYDVASIYSAPLKVTDLESELRFGDFSIPKARLCISDAGFAFDAPTTALNAMRVVRALQVQKPILIEGSPGVGKTTLIIALARAVGKEVTRINLSEQTDLMDLFGSDVPVEGAEAGNFAWRDAPFLQAMQNGHWVLLDEMNLASQSVLEGLNACLDHRGEVYISELDQTFKRHPNFTVFAAQNPHHQGGGRKGLPSSFVNRFTVVYADVFRNDDLMIICRRNFPSTDDTLMTNVIKFVSTLEEIVVYRRKFGSEGSPWEFNLRDTLRWLQLLTSKDPLLAAGSPADFLNLIFRQRFRTSKDREYVDKIFAEVFGSNVPFRHLFPNLSRDGYQVGQAYLTRNALIQRLPFPHPDITPRLPELESILLCVQQNLPCILVGPSGSGKSSLIQHIAAGAGADLVVFPLNSEVDTMDLVGGFEQVDPQRESASFIHRLYTFLETHILKTICDYSLSSEALLLLRLCQNPAFYSSEYFISVKEALTNLQRTHVLHELDELVEMSQVFANQPTTIEAARFEWVDGVLIKALEQGKWLVLDNANLCSSSVLDRLNSLLEPNGYMSINEHCDPSGEPKLVRPHPSFRLFLTMDSRFGELSRAMRNRAIEIFVDVSPLFTESLVAKPSVTIESSQVRFDNVIRALELHKSDFNGHGLQTSAALDNLSRIDHLLLPRFIKAVEDGLVSDDLSESRVIRPLNRHAGNGNGGHQLETLYNKLAKAMDLSKSFMDAQTVQPLANSPLVPLIQQCSAGDQIYWYGALLELNLDVLEAKQETEGQKLAMVNLRPSQMNRLQRSAVRARVASVAKDSTADIAEFLDYILSALRAHFGFYHEGTSDWRTHKRAIASIIHFWWETYRLATSKTFDEITFQAHLTIGQSLLKELVPRFLSLTPGLITKLTPGVALIQNIQQKLEEAFNSGFKLTTGLSMELLWMHFRPSPIPDLGTLTALVELEELATRFDSLRWNVPVSLSELASITSSLVKAYQIVLKSGVDAKSLVRAMSSELDILESGIPKHAAEVSPFMQPLFEILRQHKTLEIMRMGPLYGSSFTDAVNLEISILSNKSSGTLMSLASCSHGSQILQTVDYLCGNGEGLDIIKNSFSISLLQRLLKAGDVDLKSLRLFETELPLLGNQAAQATESLCRDPLLDMNAVLLELIEDVVAAHGYEVASYFQDSAKAVCELPFKNKAAIPNFNAKNGAQPSEDIHYLLQNHLMTALKSIGSTANEPCKRLEYSAMAWTEFAVGCIALYVPDRPFDPDIKQRLERDQHSRMRESLEDRLDSLSQFETILTGQDSNLRCQMLEEELAQLGEIAGNFQRIVRPEISELGQLQGEFNNLLSSVLHASPQKLISSVFGDDPGGKAPLELKLLQNNISQIIRRLSERFRTYSDITVPLVGFLRCLQIGMGIISMAAAEQSPQSTCVLYLSRITPFLGGSLVLNDSDATDQPIEILTKLATVSAVEGVASFDEDKRTLLSRVFHSCYEQWSIRLDADRAEAEAKSSIYQFRGSVEDEDEEDQDQFNELFPSYDENASGPVNAVVHQSARDIAIKLATIHLEIFSPSLLPVDSILSLVRSMAARICIMSETYQGSSTGDVTSSLLPGALLLLNDRIDSLSSTSITVDLYNFYLDSNLPEARKLVELVHQIQNRFKELQMVDEIGHMQPLEDVLICCKELLEFRHVDPLAKIIPKVEKLHGFMHEWQFGGWASRANSVLSLYDSLTATIIGWRRLELSTWSRLFEMENKKCDEDAKSWFFIAYQVVIAVPLSISHSESEVQMYVPKLLQDLWTYFSTAVQGQFSQRLQLLKQLQNHLELLALNFPAISNVAQSVSNFVSFNIRFEKPVAENLRTGRLTLEKAMKEVLLLASWKDTNIVALRESAQRSHHKLFKIVRKYRALLSQPVEHILKQGLPDEVNLATLTSSFQQPTLLPRVDRAALARCEENIPRWLQKPKRFLNVLQTVELMAITSQKRPDALNGPYYLESFLSNIIESISELQTATPSVLTEENKSAVKHLKSRKRNLFAETLKRLRQMGIPQNLGTEVLAKQDSLSVILSTTKNLPTVTGIDSTGIEYYLHKTLDLIPKARLAARQHSEDLSAAEVSRSIGLLEGLLQLILQQRDNFSHLASNSAKFDQVIRLAQALWAPGEYSICSTIAESSNITTLKWLPSIILVGTELLKVHEKLGKQDKPDVRQFFCTWVENFNDLARQAVALPDLPEFITCTSRNEWESNCKNRLQEFQMELVRLTKEYPDLDYIFKQIVPWVVTTSVPTSVIEENDDVSKLDQKLSKVCDSILVAIERFGETMNNYPCSTDDLVWLVKTEACIVRSLHSLNSSTVIRQVNEAFALLRATISDNEENSRTAGALFAAALPIFQQYSNVFRRTLVELADLHRSTCKMSYILTKTFTQIASEGFCTPSEKTDSQNGKTEKLEGGTGLGDGEGAEDISKDIQDDEDLSELAQEKNKGDMNDIEDEKDAVDMADDDMEGETGDSAEKENDEKGSDEDGEDGDEIDEEVGDVDDLDPNAVDEKMWDGDGEKAEKDQKGDQSEGKENKDENVAAEEDGKQGEDRDEVDEEQELGAEQSEEVQQDDAERHDPHAQESEALELPEDMDLDGDGEGDSVSNSDEGIDGLSDVNDDEKGEQEDFDDSDEAKLDGESAEGQEDQDMGSDLDVVDLDEEDEKGEGKDAEEAGEKVDEEQPHNPENQERLLTENAEDANASLDNVPPSETRGIGENQDDGKSDDDRDTANKAERDEGGHGGNSSEQQEEAAEDGQKGRQTGGQAPQTQHDETQASNDAQPFKRLGDALEKWHRQQSKIKDISEQDDKHIDHPLDIDGKENEFQHVQDEDAQADTQALGTATEDQAHTVDESMAIDQESEELPDIFRPDELEQENIEENSNMGIQDSTEPRDLDPTAAYEGRPGAIIQRANTDHTDPNEPHTYRPDGEDDVEDVDTQLLGNQLYELSLPTPTRADARNIWADYESRTRDLSHSLTSQLRLILAPTLATKMRGDFRTGKRLNIKRIIPYIASQYKRDKIWMRRSVPSKRSYQILLAVDDSQSMAKSGASALALETLVMVSKSLALLEVGEISVLGFGESIHVSHNFSEPFSAEAGPKILQSFSFDQGRTDVTKLVRTSIELFRAARQKASSSPADLWQLELIISDGVCDSSEHESIRRLLREAIAERIMIVFVIVDDVKMKKEGESVLDLKEAKFVKDEITGGQTVKIERYLDTFPFSYYLVVGDVRELPGVLAALLRQWFAEVVDAEG